MLTSVGFSSLDEILLLRFLPVSTTLVCFVSFGFFVRRSDSSSDSINRFSRLAVRTAFESSAGVCAPFLLLLLIGDRFDDFLELGDLRCALVVCFFGEYFRDSSDVLKQKFLFFLIE